MPDGGSPVSDGTDRQLTELGFYGLSGDTTSPQTLLEETATAERLGLGACFLSERFNLKDAAVLSGAAAAASRTLGIATAATNHNTRHPVVTATMATTMNRLSGGRFALGLGRGFDPLWDAMGLPRITNAQLRDIVGLLRRLWRGEVITGYDGPIGRYPVLHQSSMLNEDIPIMMVAIGRQTLELAGALADGVVLHTYFTDETLRRAVAAVRRGATKAGRDPSSVRVWSVLATVGDHIDPAQVAKKTVGRLATYLQGYGDVLVRSNGWDPGVLARFRADEVVGSVPGAIDALASPAQLEHIARLLPAEWLSASAMGTAEQCADRIDDQFRAGADGVILHGCTPTELAPVLAAYRSLHPTAPTRWPANPGRPALAADDGGDIRDGRPAI
jgi:probable F420-dependent oxidoreductase